MVALANATDIQSAKPDVTFDRREARLGDGYRRLARNGINNVRERYKLTWMEMPHADAVTLIAQLKTVGGTDVLDWQPPDEGSSRPWTCESFKHPWMSPLTKQVSAVLVEYFGP